MGEKCIIITVSRTNTKELNHAIRPPLLIGKHLEPAEKHDIDMEFRATYLRCRLGVVEAGAYVKILQGTSRKRTMAMRVLRIHTTVLFKWNSDGRMV